MNEIPLQAWQDPVFIVLAAVIVGLIFFGFLLFRRTFLGFKEGMERGRE